MIALAHIYTPFPSKTLSHILAFHQASSPPLILYSPRSPLTRCLCRSLHFQFLSLCLNPPGLTVFIYSSLSAFPDTPPTTTPCSLSFSITHAFLPVKLYVQKYADAQILLPSPSHGRQSAVLPSSCGERLSSRSDFFGCRVQPPAQL